MLEKPISKVFHLALTKLDNPAFFEIEENRFLVYLLDRYLLSAPLPFMSLSKFKREPKLLGADIDGESSERMCSPFPSYSDINKG
jgi:hypothetical protein